MPFPNIGAPELIVILIIALVVLGPGKLPDVAASLGKSVREFRKAATEVSDAGKLNPPAATTPAPAPTETAAPNTLSGSTEPNTLKAADPTADQKLS
jgi:sec-independent protein translocase protein TatA